jgi:hypothetical protein
MTDEEVKRQQRKEWSLTVVFEERLAVLFWTAIPE